MTLQYDWARWWASSGQPVFPVTPGDRTPLGDLVPHGLKDATTDESIIEAWWEFAPEANIGLPTGHLFDVVDIDGHQTRLDLEKSLGMKVTDLFKGPVVLTPRYDDGHRGGRHLLVEPTGLGNRASFGGIKGLDFRGVGGYVVGVGSRRPDGDYVFATDNLDAQHGPMGMLQPLPEPIVKLMKRERPKITLEPPKRPPGNPTEKERYSRGAIRKAADDITKSGEGSRNNTLNEAAFFAFRTLAEMGTPHLMQEAVFALHTAGRQVGLGDHEIEATLQSAARGWMAS